MCSCGALLSGMCPSPRTILFHGLTVCLSVHRALATSTATDTRSDDEDDGEDEPEDTKDD